MSAPTTIDPKQTLDEAIDAAFAHDAPAGAAASPASAKPFAWAPPAMRRVGFAGLMLGASAVISAVATLLTLAMRRRSHRAPAARTRLLFGKPTRHVGYRRYHLGRYGIAHVAYTYKLPAVRVPAPAVTFTLPPITLKLRALRESLR